MPRELAFDLLRGGSPTPLRDLDREAQLRGLEPRDRALARRLVATCLRRRGTLLALVRSFARGKPKPDLAAILHIGFAQLLFLDRVPDHAAVNTAVDAANQRLGLGKGRIVNGILRNAIRARREGACGDPRRDLVEAPWHMDHDVFRDPTEHPLLWAEDALSMPSAVMKGWSERFGREHAEELARLATLEPRLSVRVLAADVDAVLAEFQAADLVPLQRVERDLVFATDATEALVASAAFARGDATVQGAAAARAAELVGARPGERVLDLCAAPGGKCAAIARTGAEVVAVDVDPARLERVRETALRLGVASRVQTVVSDGTSSLGAGEYDAVLVDAPCSNTAVLAARPEARWRFGPASQRSLAELQARLFAEGASRVRVGGRLVWSTCSLEPGENGVAVSRFLRESSAATFELAEEHLSLPSAEGPPVDGGYAALLVRLS